VLNPRERRIFEARRLLDDPITLEDLSGEFGVSRERLRQIEVRAFQKVQEAVKKNLAMRERPRAAARCRRAKQRLDCSPPRRAASDVQLAGA
jgi:RNA polymerase sigma-32 factor